MIIERGYSLLRNNMVHITKLKGTKRGNKEKKKHNYSTHVRRVIMLRSGERTKHHSTKKMTQIY